MAVNSNALGFGGALDFFNLHFDLLENRFLFIQASTIFFHQTPKKSRGSEEGLRS
jgi:hypothetical protein